MFLRKSLDFLKFDAEFKKHIRILLAIYTNLWSFYNFFHEILRIFEVHIIDMIFDAELKKQLRVLLAIWYKKLRSIYTFLNENIKYFLKFTSSCEIRR